MRGRLSSSHLVGRVDELEELALASREVAEGHPAVVLLGGDSGVGKTRLVGELEHRLPEFVVLRGEGVEQGGGDLPYAPLVAALRPLVRARHPALGELSPASRMQLAALVPGLDAGGGVGVGNGAQPLGGEGGSEAPQQMRLFEALLELLDLLTEATPVALMLEDMHWADRSTRTFTAFLARSLRQERLMLLLTYRTDELHRRHPLRPLLAELERLERSRRIELAPFDRDELAEALTDILGEVPPERLVSRLYARSEGNALYTEELLAAGLDGRGAAPQSLRDAFLLRIERLSEDAQRAARVVAVGRRLDSAVIAAVAGIDGERLNTALREAVAEQVLVTGEDDRFLFRHALLREALYDDLLPGERGELHLALARIFAGERAPDDEREVTLATTIANHYAAAGDQPEALRAIVRAARAAGCVHAYGEAADLAERALELWPRVPDAASLVDSDHVGLLAMAARGHGIGGDRARGEALLAEALSELDPATDPVRYSRLLGHRARLLWSLNRGTEAVAQAREALAMLPDGEAKRERASMMSWLARSRVLRGHFREAVTEGDEALAAAVDAGEATIEAEVLNTLGMARISSGEVDEGVRCLRRALELSRADDDLDGAAYAYANLADMLNLVGRTGEALKIALEGLEATPRRIRGSYDWMELTVSELAFAAGRWDLSRSHLGPPPSRQIGLLYMFRQLREVELVLEEGDEDTAAACLDAVEPFVRVSTEPQWHGAYGALRAELCRRRGDLAGAQAAVAATLDELEVCTDDVMRIARITAVGLAVEADRAQRARDLRAPADAKDALARAKIHIDRLRAAAAEGGPVEAAWRAVGEATLSRARGRPDPKGWHRAALLWDALERPYVAATVRWREAEALVEADEREAAGTVAGQALAVSRELGARWLAGELEALVGRARLDVGLDLDASALAARGPNGAGRGGSGAVAGGGSDAGAAEDPFGLTPRERQVLALVAEGATNRQIGAALYMAEKTASVHVSRILSKLGVQSRTQAAAVAYRQHLA
jgi:DNA-binding CsgD family transcriptional regulator/tetratricopeptide (TPR) repeat protein